MEVTSRHARNQRGAGRAKPPQKIFTPLEKYFGHSSNLLDIVQKMWPLLENSSPPWYPKLFTSLFPGRPSRTTDGTRTTGWEPLF